jgi:hypothetical protein
MSRWLTGLNQVSTLLEKLDDRVEIVVEERAIAEDGGDGGGSHGVLIDDILSRRGLAADSKDEADETDGVNDKDSQLQPADDSSGMKSDNAGDGKQMLPNDPMTVSTRGEDQPTGVKVGHPEIGSLSRSEREKAKISEDTPKTVETTQSANRTAEFAPTTASDTTSGKTIPNIPPRNSSRSKKEVELSVASKEAQKEVRVLRRHVVKLHENLEQAENEITALRGELGRAAERMEKDRSRAKDQKEAMQKTHAEELNSQRKQHEQVLTDQKTRLTEQLGKYKEKLSELENQRKQEGGDWNKEISQAFQREEEANHRVVLLE